MWLLIWSFIAAIAVPLARTIAVGIGFGVVAYTGMSVTLDQLQGYVFSQFSGLPSQLVSILGIMQVDDAINIMFSAYAASAAMAGWRNNQRRKSALQPWSRPGQSSATWGA